MDMSKLQTARFFSKVRIKTSDEGLCCWDWIGGSSRLGYGKFGINGKYYRAYRVSLHYFGEKMKAGMVVDHMCRNPKCVNPNHLRQVTPRENALNNINNKKGFNKTKCIKGHDFTKENTYLVLHKNGSLQRRCKICRLSNWNKLMRKHKDKN